MLVLQFDVDWNFLYGNDVLIDNHLFRPAAMRSRAPINGGLARAWGNFANINRVPYQVASESVSAPGVPSSRGQGRAFLSAPTLPELDVLGYLTRRTRFL